LTRYALSMLQMTKNQKIERRWFDRTASGGLSMGYDIFFNSN